jgi:hypothetical protein
VLRSSLEGEWTQLLLALWPSWGFCVRHAVGFASAELELEGRLLLTGVLHEHYVEGAAWIACGRLRTWRGVRAGLSARASCAICERAHGAPAGDVDFARRVNRRGRLRDGLEEMGATWERRACPLCVPAGGGLVCRPHLLAGARQDGLAERLEALSARLRRLVGSMTTARTPTDALDRFSWLEAVAWLGGWPAVRRLMLEGGGADER